jgi:glycerol-3-phosphate dehydrogenase
MQDRGGGVVLLASTHFANGAAGSSSALAHGVTRYSLLDRRHSQVHI